MSKQQLRLDIKSILLANSDYIKTGELETVKYGYFIEVSDVDNVVKEIVDATKPHLNTENSKQGIH